MTPKQRVTVGAVAVVAAVAFAVYQFAPVRHAPEPVPISLPAPAVTIAPAPVSKAAPAPTAGPVCEAPKPAKRKARKPLKAAPVAIVPKPRPRARPAPAAAPVEPCGGLAPVDCRSYQNGGLESLKLASVFRAVR